MNTRLLLACVIVSGLAAPAFARNYYIVQNPKTLKCSVLPKKPKGKTPKRSINAGSIWI